MTPWFPFPTWIIFPLAMIICSSLSKSFKYQFHSFFVWSCDMSLMWRIMINNRQLKGISVHRIWLISVYLEYFSFVPSDNSGLSDLHCLDGILCAAWKWSIGLFSFIYLSILYSVHLMILFASFKENLIFLFFKWWSV